MHSSLTAYQIDRLLDQADTQIRQGRPERAAELAQRVTVSQPDHAEGHYILGLALLQTLKIDEAIAHLSEAARLDPGCPEFAAHLARALAHSGRFGEAIAAANTAFNLGPDQPHTLAALGTVYGQCNLHERALTSFRLGSALAPGDGNLRFNLGIARAFAGEIDAAEADLEASLKLMPNNWRAHDVIARLRPQRPDKNHIARLGELLQITRGNRIAQSHLHMARGKELEDLGDYEGAFAHFTAGNHAARAGQQYTIDQDEERVRALIQAFEHPGPDANGCLTEEPIFVVGMPRSGTTLVERIISSHPEVYSAGELLNFGTCLQNVKPDFGFEALRTVAHQKIVGVNWNELGGSYLQSTRPATAIKPRFVDKFPHNFFYVGFIARALPRARIICLRRDPMDTCLSNFREHFSELSPYHGYASNLMDTGRYFVLFDKLMKHWKSVFPGRVLDVSYEAIVAAPEAASRALIEHCGLPWTEACERFELNSAPSATASSSQVRSPIYRTSMQRWKKYGPCLDGLRALLNEAGVGPDIAG